MCVNSISFFFSRAYSLLSFSFNCSPHHPAVLVKEFTVVFRYGFDHVRLKPWPVTSSEGTRARFFG